MLVSGALIKIMTPRMISYMRMVDICTVKGSIEPMEMWTCDVDVTALEDEKPPKKKESK